MADNDSQAYPFLRPAATSAFTGGCLITLTLTPFDVIKNYWYYNDALASNRTRVGSLYVVRHIYNSRGIRAFWNGSSWASVNTISGQMIFLWLYESLRQSHNIFFSSICSRIAALTVCSPFDCIKTWNQANMFDHRPIRPFELFKLANISRLYSGFIPTLVRDIPYSAIHWSCYDYLIKKSHEITIFKENNNIARNIMFPMMCGTVSSVLAVVVSQPFDILKTNMQAKIGEPGNKVKRYSLAYFYREIANIYYVGGIKGFGIGILPRIARVVPSSAIMMAAYEYFKNSNKITA